MKPCFCVCFPQNITILYQCHRSSLSRALLIACVCSNPSTYYVHLLNILSLACGQELQWLSWDLISATVQPAENSSRIGLGGPRIYKGPFIAATASDTWPRQKRTQDRDWIGKALLLSLSLSYASCLFLFPFKASFTSWISWARHK